MMEPVLESVPFQSNRTNRMCVQNDIYLKKWAYVFVGTGKSEICRAGRRTQVELTLSFMPEGILLAELFLP